MGALAAGVFVLAASPLPLAALDPEHGIHQHNCRTWRRANGLPANAITTVTQASDGFIWIGSSKGLTQFDGVDFRPISLPGDEGAGGRLITSMAPRSTGGFWLGLERGGLGRFDSAGFEGLNHPDLGGAFATVRVVAESRDGSLLVGTVVAGARWRPGSDPEVLTPETDVLTFHEDGQGRIWMGTAAHGLLYRQDGETRTFPDPGGRWEGRVVSAVAVDHDGLIWVGASNGLHGFNPDFSPRPPTGIIVQPRALLVDRHGVLWIGTTHDGLHRHHDGVFSHLRQADGLASDRIRCLAESDDGSIWVGTEDGLSQLSDVKFPIFSVADGLSSEACLAVGASPRGGVWAANTNGLSRFRDGVFASFGVDKADGFHSRWVKRVFEASNGEVYLVCGRMGLSRLSGDRVVKTWELEEWPRALAEDARGVLVSVAGRVMRIEGDELVPYRLADGSPVVFRWISELLVARNGSLWIAHDDGVAEIRDGALHRHIEGEDRTGRAFLYLCEDDGGAVWAARNSGLVRIKGGGQRAFVGREKGLHEAFLYAIVADTAGNFWMDSSEGIFRVDQQGLNAVADGSKARLEYTVFDGEHAVKTADKAGQEHTGCRSLDGRIWFPSVKGLIMIDPARVRMNTRPPAVFLQRVLVNGRECALDRAPELDPGPGNLEFDYSALDYQAPEKLRFAYRLEGYETEWVDAGGRRAAFYTNIPPGRYRFQLHAGNADGQWNIVGATFSFELPRRLFETPWFRAVAGFSLLGVGAAAWWVRERGRRREIREIRRREELQRQMIESSPVAMAMLAEDRHLLCTNVTFTRLFGYTADEISDQDAWWRLAVRDATRRAELRAEWAQRVDAAGKLERPIEPLELTVTCKDGSTRAIAFTTSEVGARTLIVCADLTDRKRAEEQRLWLEEQLRQHQKMQAIGQLSGGVAHDFNNLLTVILGNLSLVDMEEVKPRSLIEPLAEVKDAARRAANLTRQLLAFSRNQTIRPVGLDLNALVYEMMKMLRRIVGEDVAMELHLCPTPAPVHADAAMLEQVLLNLAVNARDAMLDGGRLTISTRVVDVAADELPPVPNARAGRFVCLGVADTGAGIPPEILPRIFEPFFTTKDVGRGTGLGLATVYGVVEQHSGWIHATSEIGVGTVFRVYLPWHPGGASGPGGEPAAEPAAVAGKGLMILLVEDESSVRSLARRVLVDRGFRVVEAATGPEALQVWARYRDDVALVVTDIVMPDGMSGLELARRLLEDKPGLRVIYASGYNPQVAGRGVALEAGVNFLPKPYDPDALLRIVDPK